MAQTNKNSNAKNKRSEFDIEEDFQEQQQSPASRPSEPARSEKSKVAGAVNKDKLNQASAKKI